MRERLTTAINDLPERERLVLTLYYYQETTMKEIGLILDVVDSRVSQILASAVVHLRAALWLREPSKSHDMRKRSRNISARGEENGGLEVSFPPELHRGSAYIGKGNRSAPERVSAA